MKSLNKPKFILFIVGAIVFFIAGLITKGIYPDFYWIILCIACLFVYEAYSEYKKTKSSK